MDVKESEPGPSVSGAMSVRRASPDPVVVCLGEMDEELRAFDRLLGDEALALLVRDGLAGVAKREGMSKRTVRRRLKETGKTASEVVRTIRIEVALKMLKGSDPFRSISLQLGYESARCFSRFVSREFGRTPTEMRKKLHVERPARHLTRPSTQDVSGPSGLPYQGTPIALQRNATSGAASRHAAVTVARNRGERTSSSPKLVPK